MEGGLPDSQKKKHQIWNQAENYCDWMERLQYDLVFATDEQKAE